MVYGIPSKVIKECEILDHFFFLFCTYVVVKEAKFGQSLFEVANSFHPATETFDLSDVDKRSIEDLRVQLESRRVWLASSIHRGEEEG